MWTVPSAGAELRALGERWADLLERAGDAVVIRPAPEVWSAVEYTVHTGEIARFWREGLVALFGGAAIGFDPTQYPDADVYPYNEVPAGEAVAELIRQLSELVELRPPSSEDWSAPLR